MESIRVLVCGAWGRMGQEVVRAVSEADGMSVVAAVDVLHAGQSVESLGGPKDVITTDDLAGTIEQSHPDVMVDFTNPAVVWQNVKTAISLGVRPVIGATGLSDEEVCELDATLKAQGLGGLLASNFAIGAVLMMQFSRQAARYLPDVEIIEYHHDNKLDAPSGTALSTAREIARVRTAHRQGHPDEQELLSGARGASFEGIPIHSVRLAGRVAHQEVIFGSAGQILTIRHDSIDRKSFMPGVVLGVRAVMDRTELVVGLDKLL